MSREADEERVGIHLLLEAPGEALIGDDFLPGSFLVEALRLEALGVASGQ